MSRSEAPTIANDLLLAGDVRPNQAVGVRLKTAGRIDRITIREAERVVEDQLMFRLTQEGRLARRREARAQIARVRNG